MCEVRVYSRTEETEENATAFYTYIEDGVTIQRSPYVCELFEGSNNCIIFGTETGI